MKEFPPVPKKIFPNTAKRQSKIEFCKDLRKALFDLRASLPANRAHLGDMIVRFAGYIGPQDNLPYLAINGKAKNRNKNECVAALISWVIQQGWRFQKDEISADEAYTALNQLRQITDTGLNKYKVIGDAKGYYLEVQE